MPCPSIPATKRASNDPAYYDTWAYLLTDFERKTRLLVHASWFPPRAEPAIIS